MIRLSLSLFAVLCLFGDSASAQKREIVIANEALRLGGEHVEGNLAAFLRRVEKATGWPKNSLRGKAFPNPRDALDYIARSKPAFAILPPHQFLEGRQVHGFQVLGRAVGTEGVRIAYWGVTRKEERPYEHMQFHPGLRLVMTETYDLQWINVLFDGVVRPAFHFKLQDALTSDEALAAVLARKADVALIYEREFQPLRARIENRTDLDWIYTSVPIPPPAVVAAKWTSKADQRRLAGALTKICKLDGGPDCARMAIMYLEPGRADTYKNIILKYDTYR
jgi:hypothetical protein